MTTILRIQRRSRARSSFRKAILRLNILHCRFESPKRKRNSERAHKSGFPARTTANSLSLVVVSRLHRRRSTAFCFIFSNMYSRVDYALHSLRAQNDTKIFFLISFCQISFIEGLADVERVTYATLAWIKRRINKKIQNN